MLNALSVILPGGDKTGTDRAAGSFVRQGFVPSAEFGWTGGTLIGWTYPARRDVSDSAVQAQDLMACCVGSLWYKSSFGVAALEKLVRDVEAADGMDEMALHGNFALFVHTPGRSWLLNDPLGLVRIYASADGCFYSTSWLATCAYVGQVRLDDAAAAEYVLLGATHSERTVAQSVKRLELGHAYDLQRRRVWSRFPSGAVTDSPEYGDVNVACEATETCLRAIFAEIASPFSQKLTTALTGGFDSRLILAGLLATGATPSLFTFGGEESADVPIARVVAEAASLPLDVIDKRLVNQAMLPVDLESLKRNALFFDGLPNDGIYDPGADRQTRLQQNAGGHIALNGGGGEIFRNFFHLPDHPFRAAEIVRAFYRGFDARIFRLRRGLAEFEEGLASSMLKALGMGGSDANVPLARPQVELIYPLFRCHHWMSVNNSVAVRHGHYITPLVNLQLVRIAHLLPLRWKNAGSFESRLITALDFRVASQRSIYGFRFSDGPNWRARMAEWLACVRPASVRPLINTASRRMHGVQATPNAIRECRSLLPGEWYLDPLLDMNRLPDNSSLGRAVAVEVVLRYLL